MGRKTKQIAVPCLAAAMAIAGLALPKTLAIFTDSETYSFLIYPYDGRGEGYLTFEDGSTIHGFEDGASCRLKYTFANSSAAIIADLLITFTLPDGSTMERHLTDIAPGAEKSVEAAAVLSHEMLEPGTEPRQDSPQKYRPVTASATVIRFRESAGSAVQDVSVPSHSSIVYIYRQGGNHP